MSRVKYHQADFQRALQELGIAVEEGANLAMGKVVRRAAQDAAEQAAWNPDGAQPEVTYPSGDTWEWEVTGYARASIQGYVVPNKRLSQLPYRETTSRKNGLALKHPHHTDDSVTEDYAEQDGVVLGVVTMNVAYAPYLQEWEMDGNDQEYPVTVQVFEANWSRYYIPAIVEPAIHSKVEEVAKRYT